MRQQIITPGRSPIWRPGFDEETYERSRIVVPPDFLRVPLTTAYTLIANTLASSSNNVTVTTSGIDTTGADLIVISVCRNATVAPTDSNANTWTALTAQTGAGVVKTQLYYCVNPTVGAAHTFTENSGALTFPSIAVQAWSGTAASPFDSENGATTASATSLATGSVTPSQDNCLLVYALGDQGSGVTVSVDVGTISNQAGNNSNAQGLCMAYQVQTTATTRNPTFSWSVAARGEAVIAVFKAAGGGGGVALRQNALLNGLGSSGPFFRNPLG